MTGKSTLFTGQDPNEESEESRKLSQYLFGFWNSLIVIVTTIGSFIIPFSLVHEDPNRMFYVREVVLTVLFVLDIVFSMRRLKANHSVQFFEVNILRSYYKRWFFLDIIAAIPFALFLPIPILEYIRFLKLVKVAYLAFILARTHLNLANMLLVAQVIYWTMLLTHWLSCGWLYIQGLAGSVNTTEYINALYWTVTTLTTVGYGDIVPANNAERIYAIITMILGYSIMGYLIGAIAGILTKKNPYWEKYLQNLEQLSNAVRHAQLPLDLQQRIHAYFLYKMERGFGYDESSFIDQLPPGLRAEVSLHFRREIIEEVPLFKDAPEEFILEIAQHLKEHIVPAGDCIFNTGDPGDKMYFISRGEVNVFRSDVKTPISVLKPGDYFGEIALFNDIPRTATVRAYTYCDLYSLNKEAFQKIFDQFPEVQAKVFKKAELRRMKG